MLSRAIPRTARTIRLAPRRITTGPGGQTAPGAPNPNTPKKKDDTPLYIAGAAAVALGAYWYLSKETDPAHNAAREVTNQASNAADAMGRQAEKAADKFDEVKRDVKRAM